MSREIKLYIARKYFSTTGTIDNELVFPYGDSEYIGRTFVHSPGYSSLERMVGRVYGIELPKLEDLHLPPDRDSALANEENEPLANIAKVVDGKMQSIGGQLLRPFMATVPDERFLIRKDSVTVKYSRLWYASYLVGNKEIISASGTTKEKMVSSWQRKLLKITELDWVPDIEKIPVYKSCPGASVESGLVEHCVYL